MFATLSLKKVEFRCTRPGMTSDLPVIGSQSIARVMPSTMCPQKWMTHSRFDTRDFEFLLTLEMRIEKEI
uniref:Uncharacterized protein n=1 Tax=Timema monikensis TaxID=170555 RepID=A0A7R9E4U6_9NEOP|nr:unnamed protein product [Timema monikensis]